MKKRKKKKIKSGLTLNLKCSKALQVKEKKTELSRPKENNQKII